MPSPVNVEPISQGEVLGSEGSLRQTGHAAYLLGASVLMEILASFFKD